MSKLVSFPPFPDEFFVQRAVCGEEKEYFLFATDAEQTLDEDLDCSHEQPGDRVAVYKLDRVVRITKKTKITQKRIARVK